MEMMDRARALAPADAALLARRARFLHLLGRLPEAERELTRARELSPDDSQIRYELLLVRVLLGRGKQVAAELKKHPVPP
ncbi:MAG: tetratricopeptide repeat protein, partial [Elusimicrobiota bacterium]